MGGAGAGKGGVDSRLCGGTLVVHDDRVGNGSVCGSRLVVLNCDGLWVGLGGRDRLCWDHGHVSHGGLGDNVKVGTGGVVLVLACWIVAVHVCQSGELPDPVCCQCARGNIGRDLDITLAPALNGRCSLTSDVVGLEHLSLLGDAAAIDLVATSVVKVLRSHEEALAVTTRASLVPCHNIGNLLVIRRLSGAKDEDCAAAGRLAGDVPRERDVPILKILHCDVVARSDFKLGVCRSVVGRSL